MKFNSDYLKYEFLNHTKIREAYLLLQADKNPLYELFKVYSSIQIDRYYVCIGKFERFTKHETTIEYIFLDIFENKCKNIISIAEFDWYQIEKTDLYLDDIYSSITFQYNENFYDAIDFSINMFF